MILYLSFIALVISIGALIKAVRTERKLEARRKKRTEENKEFQRLVRQINKQDSETWKYRD